MLVKLSTGSEIDTKHIACLGFVYEDESGKKTRDVYILGVDLGSDGNKIPVSEEDANLLSKKKTQEELDEAEYKKELLTALKTIAGNVSVQ